MSQSGSRSTPTYVAELDDYGLELTRTNSTEAVRRSMAPRRSNDRLNDQDNDQCEREATEEAPISSVTRVMSDSPLLGRDRAPTAGSGQYEAAGTSQDPPRRSADGGSGSNQHQHHHQRRATGGRLSSSKSRSRLSRRSRRSLEQTFTSGIQVPGGIAKLPEGFSPTSAGGPGSGSRHAFFDSDASTASEDDDDEEAALHLGSPRSAGSSTDRLPGAGGEGDADPPDNSPYPQVGASVAATDDATLSISTPRMWTLALVFALGGSAANLFFSLRYPSVAISPIIALILTHPLGKGWDWLLKRPGDPVAVFEGGWRVVDEDGVGEGWGRGKGRWERVRVWLAQGKWNAKEHACVYISSNVAFGFAFATDVIVEQKMFYHQEVPLLYQLLLTISTQILGYAFAGLTRRYLVRPPSMIWPGTLMSAAMFTTLHRSENRPADGWSVSRWRFFFLVWLGAFAWYFVPGLLAPALSYFNVLTWLAPDSVVVANLFGVSSGLGLFPVTFDWAQIAYIGSPLLTPWWAAANVFSGLAVLMWIVAPILYYRNALYAAFMPILSSSIFDNTGKIYDVSKILTPQFLFDEDAFKSYSPIYMPITYVLSYAAQFGSLGALVSHTACWHGRDIIEQTRQSFSDRPDDCLEYQVLNSSRERLSRVSTSSEGAAADIGFDVSFGGGDVHNRLMNRYEDAPIYWYIAILVAMLAIGIFIVEYYPVHLPYYGLLLALSITTIMFLPVAIIMAITNQHSSLYLISQLICGYVFPGRPVANMVFTTYAYISSAQGIKFSSDLKLGHYMKVPPRILFTVQLVATLLSSLVQVGVLNWMFQFIPGLCTPEAINGFNCPIARVHFNGSILWGVVGPGRFFGRDSIYRGLIWAFPAGFIAPIITWYIAKRKKRGIWKKMNFPLLLGSISWIPPATGLNFSVWTIVCFTFNHAVRRRAPAWWSKYTMTLSAALDSGLAFGLVVVFFGIVYPGFADGFRWWGTEVYKRGCDWKACPLREVPTGGHFGPP